MQRLLKREQAFIVLDTSLRILTVSFRNAKGKVDEVIVTPNVKPKLFDQSQNVAFNKDKGNKRSREQKLKSGTGKSRPPFQLKIKPRSK
jgi:hypothetical protein